MRLCVDRKFRTARHWSNTVLRHICPHFNGTVVNVSGWEDSDKEGGKYREYFSCAEQYDISNFPGERGLTGVPGEIHLDLEKDLEPALREKYDVVFNHTALEHIYDVHKAFANLCAMAKDAVIIVVPFLQEMHYTDSYGDYWRFTPFAIQKMFEANGFHLVFVDANDANRESVYLLAVGRRKMIPLPVTPSHDAFVSLGSRALSSYSLMCQIAHFVARIPKKTAFLFRKNHGRHI
jgi:hypothetical protein